MLDMTHARANDHAQNVGMTLQQAEELRQGLNNALRAEGIVLPSLRVDISSYADTNAPVLIELGRCNGATARRLLDLLETHRALAT